MASRMTTCMARIDLSDDDAPDATAPIFAFNDGVYDLATCEWTPAHKSAVHGACIPHAMNYAQVLQKHWRDIATPNFDSILDHHQLPAAVQDWVFVMMGRLLYKIGDKDIWEVIPLFKGLAGTTICKIMLYLFGVERMGILSNNTETRELSAFRTKLAYIAPDITPDFKLDQAPLMTMVLGESVDDLKWDIHGMLAGNEHPQWVDNSGSMSRHIVMFDFTKVHNAAADPNLIARIQTETGPLLVKINAAYLDATSQFGHTRIWDVLPPYCHSAQKKLQSHMIIRAECL